MEEVDFARDTIAFVQMFLQMGITNPWFYRAFIGRLYYAAHHLGRRLLAEAGLQPADWRVNVHQRVTQELNQHYVVSGRMSRQAWLALGELCGLRLAADYELQRSIRLRHVNHALALFTRFAQECYHNLEVS